MKNFQFPYQVTDINGVDEEIKDILLAATMAARHAYAPYSRFLVGAAVLMEDGTVITGTNLENAAYPTGICAERAALSSLNMSERKKAKAIAIGYLTPGDAVQPLSPCGMCRQFILEIQLYQGSPIAVYMSGPSGEIIAVQDASWLLPFHFSSDYLKNNDHTH